MKKILFAALLLVPQLASAEILANSPELTPDCKAKFGQVKLGMTREALEGLISHDGGTIGSIKRERYVLCPCGKGNVAKITVDYMPVGVTPKTYNDAYLMKDWMKKHRPKKRERPDDVLAKHSLPYCDIPNLR